eukprot:1942434-Rhodomonas_salina.2
MPAPFGLSQLCLECGLASDEEGKVAGPRTGQHHCRIQPLFSQPVGLFVQLDTCVGLDFDQQGVGRSVSEGVEYALEEVELAMLKRLESEVPAMVVLEQPEQAERLPLQPVENTVAPGLGLQHPGALGVESIPPLPWFRCRRCLCPHSHPWRRLDPAGSGAGCLGTRPSRRREVLGHTEVVASGLWNTVRLVLALWGRRAKSALQRPYTP